MNTQLIKFFFLAKQNTYAIRHFLMRSVDKKVGINNWCFMRRSFDEMFTYSSGVISFWYDKPLENGLKTTAVENFKTFRYYFLLLKRKLRWI